MNIREGNPNDYKNISDIQRSWELPVTPESWLGTSFLAEDGKNIVCIGSVYQLGNTPMFWIEGLVSNREIQKQDRKDGLKLLVNHLFNYAKSKGAEIVLASTPRESLKDLFIEAGFNTAPEKYFHLGRFN